MNDASERRVRRTTTVLARRVAGEMVLVPVVSRPVDALTRSAELFVLNATAERLWEMLETPSTPSQLARNLMSEFAVDADRAWKDTSAFVRALLEIGALEEIESEDVNADR